MQRRHLFPAVGLSAITGLFARSAKAEEIQPLKQVWLERCNINSYCYENWGEIDSGSLIGYQTWYENMQENIIFGSVFEIIGDGRGIPLKQWAKEQTPYTNRNIREYGMLLYYY